MKNLLRVLLVSAGASMVAVGVACGSFDEAPSLTPSAEAGADGAADGAVTPTDGASPDAPADAGGEACATPCADTRVAMTTEDIRSLGCSADPNGPIYVGTSTQILAIDKTTFALSVYASRTARHITDNGPTYSTGDQVLKGKAGTLIAAGQTNAARGVAVNPSTIFWARRDPFEVRTLPRNTGPDAGNVLAALPDFGEGVLLRANNVYVAIPVLNKIVAFDVDGGAPQADIQTGESAYALANDGAHLYWVAPGAAAIRWVQWATPGTINDFFVAPATSHAMLSICTDDTWVYFGFDHEVHRLPVVP